MYYRHLSAYSEHFLQVLNQQVLVLTKLLLYIVIFQTAFHLENLVKMSVVQYLIFKLN